MVALQFNFSNPNAVPPYVKRFSVTHPKETLEKRMKRKNRSSGVMVIEPTERCSLAKFSGELEAARYEMVNALYEKRIDGKDPSGMSFYHMVYYLFARDEFVELSQEFKNMRSIIRAELQSMCEAAMWRVRLFSNPFYKNGEEIVGQRAVSINMTARTPLFRPDGRPIMVRQRDERGAKIGDAPLPLKAEHCICVMDGAIQIVSA